MKNTITSQMPVIIGVGVLCLAAGFGGGMFYAKQSTPQQGQFGNFQGRGGNRQFGGSGAGGMRFGNGNTNGFVRGTVLSQDASSITVKLQDGSSKIVLLSDSTSITKSEKGSASDIAANKEVLVIGKTNSDGSVTAQSVQLDPQIGGRMMIRDGGATPGSGTQQ